MASCRPTKQAIRATLYIRDLCPLMVFFSFLFSVSFFLFVSHISSSFFLSFLFLFLKLLLTNATRNLTNLWSIGT